MKAATRSDTLKAGLKYRPETGFSKQKYNLTIGKQPQFIWFRNAKVATRTIFAILDTVKADLSVSSFGNVYYPIEHYQSHFKFAFVRNPWDRLVSGWLSKIHNDNKLSLYFETSEQTLCFESFVNYIAQQDIKTVNKHFRCQVELIDLQHMNFVGRFESFEDDMRHVLNSLGIDLKVIPWHNKTINRQAYQAYYNERTKGLVGEIYKADIDAFSYKFNDQ